MATAPSPTASLLFVSGLEREAAIFAGPTAISIYGDAPTLQAKFGQLVDLPLRLVVSCGICGGLDPQLRPGDLVVGTDVVAEGGGITADKTVIVSLARYLANEGQRAVFGRMAA